VAVIDDDNNLPLGKLHFSQSEKLNSSELHFAERKTSPNKKIPKLPLKRKFKDAKFRAVPP
jgi:hypothetical protein